VRCKKWALIEFLVTENKSVTNTYKWFKNVCNVRAVDNNTGILWNYWILGSEKNQAELSDTHVWLTNNGSHSGVVATWWWTHSKRSTDYSQKACKWAVSNQGRCEKNDTLKYSKCVLVGSHEAQHTDTKLCGKKYVWICRKLRAG